MITLYGIPNCDTIRKARRWLKEHQVDYRFHDFRKEGLDKAQLTEWVDELGWEVLLNKRGTTWRKLSDEQKASISRDNAIELMLEYPAMIKRPVLDTGQRRLIGFKEQQYQSELLA
jgi:Spx/MgsR family transcriptional regulator